MNNFVYLDFAFKNIFYSDDMPLSSRQTTPLQVIELVKCVIARINIEDIYIFTQTSAFKVITQFSAETSFVEK